MAELLIFARDNGHADPVKMARSSWRMGHVVHVAPDGHPWGAGERAPTFWRIRVPGAPVEVFQDLLDESFGSTLDVRGQRVRLGRRVLRLNPSPALQAQLATSQIVEMPLGDLLTLRVAASDGVRRDQIPTETV